jgi:amidohydrolase
MKDRNKKITVITCLAILFTLTSFSASYGQNDKLNEKIISLAEKEAEVCKPIYIDLHKNPELSSMEFETSKKMAEDIRKAGLEVITGIGGNGVAGIFRNGKGKVIMIRTDMDALPVKENTGLPFASTVVMKDASGKENPAMHACGHDLHMTTWLGIVQAMVALKDEWKGTLVAIAQPAEEGANGAKGMIDDNLFKKVPVPDYAICYHVNADMPVGTIGYCPGPILAGVNSTSITVYGSGGHGAMPQNTIDPVVLAARIVLDIQTIVSRKINPTKPAVVTVGAIHGGTKNNIIPDEVNMLLSIRFFEDEVFQTIKTSLINIARGDAIAAGLPENKMPLIVFENPNNPPTKNDPALVMKSAVNMKKILGDKNVIQVDPSTGSEDFAQYGLTDEKIPIALFWQGGVNQEKYRDHIEKGTLLAPIHNSSFYPDFEPAFKTGVKAMTRNLIDLFNNSK